MTIENYEYGSMTIDSQTYEADLILFPESVEQNWTRENEHNLCLDDLTTVTAYDPEMVIIGRGFTISMDIEQAVKNYFAGEGITFYYDTTVEACNLYNMYLEQGIDVVGCFYLTE
jgi:hypothetical protein